MGSTQRMLKEIDSMTTTARRRDGTTRDTQRYAVYNWEWSWPQGGVEKQTLTLAECESLVHKIWNDYKPGTRIPTVTWNKGGRWSWGDRFAIKLSTKGMNPIVVIHETAHALNPDTNDRHGPQFARILLELAVEYGGVDRRTAIRLAQEPGRDEEGKPLRRTVEIAGSAAMPSRAPRALKGFHSRRKPYLAEVAKAEQGLREARAKLAEYDRTRPTA